MGCCESKRGSAFIEGSILRAFLENREVSKSKVGLNAQELRTIDFASGRPTWPAAEDEHETVGGGESAVSLNGGMMKSGRRVPLRVPRDFMTLKEALLSALDGDRIEVSEGVYREFVSVARSVELVGVGRVDKVILEGPLNPWYFPGAPPIQHAALVVMASDVKIRNMTICLPGTTGVVIDNMVGELALEGCCVRGGDIGIRTTSSATTLARYCDVHSCNTQGVSVSKQAYTSLDKCHIFSSLCCVGAKGLGTQVGVHQCDVDGAGQVGLTVTDGAEGLVEDCDVQRNEVAGVFVNSEARVVVVQSRICNNNNMGVCVLKNSSGSITNCNLTNNGASPRRCGLHIGASCLEAVAAFDNELDAPISTPAAEEIDGVLLSLTESEYTDAIKHFSGSSVDDPNPNISVDGSANTMPESHDRFAMLNGPHSPHYLHMNGTSGLPSSDL